MLIVIVTVFVSSMGFLFGAFIGYMLGKDAGAKEVAEHFDRQRLRLTSFNRKLKGSRK